MLLPVPADVPAQIPVYQRITALLPRLPPFKRNVTDVPLHTESAVAVMLVGAAEKVFTFTALLRQTVVLQVPSIRAK